MDTKRAHQIKKAQDSYLFECPHCGHDIEVSKDRLEEIVDKPTQHIILTCNKHFLIDRDFFTAIQDCLSY